MWASQSFPNLRQFGKCANFPSHRERSPLPQTVIRLELCCASFRFCPHLTIGSIGILKCFSARRCPADSHTCVRQRPDPDHLMQQGEGMQSRSGGANRASRSASTPQPLTRPCRRRTGPGRIQAQRPGRPSRARRTWSGRPRAAASARTLPARLAPARAACRPNP